MVLPPNRVNGAVSKVTMLDYVLIPWAGGEREAGAGGVRHLRAPRTWLQLGARPCKFWKSPSHGWDRVAEGALSFV